MKKVILALIVAPMLLLIGCKESETVNGPVTTSGEWNLIYKAQAGGYFWDYALQTKTAAGRLEILAESCIPVTAEICGCSRKWSNCFSKMCLLR